MRKLNILLWLLVSSSGCIEEFDLNRDEMAHKLVVEGLITNHQGPYYIRLTESYTGRFVEPDYSMFDNAIPVKNAKMVITDNFNQVDTLVPCDFNPDEYNWDHNLPMHKFIYDAFGNIIDTLFLTDPINFNYGRGFYKTRNLVGIPGRTYSLKVISEGKEYNATAYMPQVPEIDSVGYFRKIMEKDGQEYYVPLLYFSEPQGVTNYYLIQLNYENSIRSYISGLWQFSILTDEFLQPYVNGLNISIGETPGGNVFPIFMEGDSIYIGLSSLTLEAFQFYKALLQQFKNDGGAFQPAPGSPPTNISNGALGYFRASALSEKRTKIPRPF